MPPSAPATPLPRSISVRVVAAGDAFEGEVRVNHRDGRATIRRLTSTRCEEVADALEFIAAIAIGLEVSPTLREHTTQPSVVISEHETWRLLAAVGAALVSGAGPSLEFGPELVIGLTFDARGSLAPSIELAAHWVRSETITTQSGEATLALVSGDATGCPVRWTLGAGLAVRPCIAFGVGQISGSASGAGVVSAPAQSQAWLTLTPMARVEWQPSRRFRLYAGGGPDFHFEQTRFFFLPSGVPVYRVPEVGADARLGVAVLFP